MRNADRELLPGSPVELCRSAGAQARATRGARVRDREQPVPGHGVEVVRGQRAADSGRCSRTLARDGLVVLRDDVVKAASERLAEPPDRSQPRIGRVLPAVDR